MKTAIFFLCLLIPCFAAGQPAVSQALAMYNAETHQFNVRVEYTLDNPENYVYVQGQTDCASRRKRDDDPKSRGLLYFPIQESHLGSYPDDPRERRLELGTYAFCVYGGTGTERLRSPTCPTVAIDEDTIARPDSPVIWDGYGYGFGHAYCNEGRGVQIDVKFNQIDDKKVELVEMTWDGESAKTRKLLATYDENNDGSVSLNYPHVATGCLTPGAYTFVLRSKWKWGAYSTPTEYTVTMNAQNPGAPPMEGELIMELRELRNEMTTLREQMATAGSPFVRGIPRMR